MVNIDTNATPAEMLNTSTFSEQARKKVITYSDTEIIQVFARDPMVD